MPVDTPCAEYEEKFSVWQKLDDFYEGEDAVKSRGSYLPPLPSIPNENPEITRKYNGAYQRRALFYNAVKRTVEAAVGLIFNSEPTIDGNSKALVEPALADITPRGEIPLDGFGQEVCRQIMKLGRVGILVDAPEKYDAKKDKPYALLYRAIDCISWRTKRRGSNEILSRVVLREHDSVEDPEDPFVAKSVTRYRVCELIDDVYTQSLWIEEEGEKEKTLKLERAGIIPGRRGEAMDFIPFVFINPTTIGPDISDPPLEDLANVNAAHFRNSADLEHALHYVALPTLVIMDDKIKTGGQDFPIGSSTALVLNNGGSAQMLEISGGGIAAIASAMDEKKKQMASLGARLLEDQPNVEETATSVRMRTTGESATLLTVSRSVSAGLTKALRWIGWWIGTDATPDDVDVSVGLSTDFYPVHLSPAEVRDLMLAWQSDGISFKTFYHNLRRGGIARPGVSDEDELEEIRIENKTEREEAQKNAPPQLKPFMKGGTPPKESVPEEGPIEEE